MNSDATAPNEASSKLSERDFLQLVQLVHEEAGIVLDAGKRPLVYARLSRRLRALNLTSFDAYCSLVAAEDGKAERRRMVEALTTNVTRFFREAHHFDHLTTTALPRMIAAARQGQRIRLWSAGCSSGEEPYSIALTVLNALPNASQFDIRVLATDIDTEMLRRGVEGRYPEPVVARIEPALRDRWFAPEADGAGWQVGSALRALVTFRAANLIGEWPMRGPFQAIFCRNTVIYFDPATCKDIWQKMFARLAPGGFLYVGHSERMPLPTTQFSPAGLSTYQRVVRGGP